MEHILYKAILIYLEKYNILTDCQHGFRQGRSYETQLVTTREDIALNMDSGIQNAHAYMLLSPPTPSRNQRVVVNGK